MNSSMKSALFVLLAVLAAALTVVPAQAQSGIHESVNVPFDFSVGDTHMAAGMYTVAEAQPRILAVNSVEGRQNIFATTFLDDSANTSRHAHLVFVRYGSEWFLDKVFLSSDNDFQKVVPTRREKELARRQQSDEQMSLLIQPAR